MVVFVLLESCLKQQSNVAAVAALHACALICQALTRTVSVLTMVVGFYVSMLAYAWHLARMQPHFNFNT